MFKRSKRITRTAFPEAVRTGRRVLSPHFSAVISENSAGYAVVVSKKTAKLSTTRHTIKRRVLSALKTTPLPPSVIIYPKKGVEKLTYKQIQEELQKLLS